MRNSAVLLRMVRFFSIADCYFVSSWYILKRRATMSDSVASLWTKNLFLREPIVSQLLLQQALEIKEHQGRFILGFRLDEILEVTFLIEPDGRDICINGYEPTTS